MQSFIIVSLQCDGEKRGEADLPERASGRRESFFVFQGAGFR